MNNNRNNSNRRRGRNTNRPQGGASGSQANRIDNRARGNAPQMLDKYKKLAQDAQHNGDRVQTEYYLQFADHYFRVIADNKARQDEARGKRGDGDDNRGDGRSDSRNDGRNDRNNDPRSDRNNDDDEQDGSERDEREDRFRNRRESEDADRATRRPSRRSRNDRNDDDSGDEDSASGNMQDASGGDDDERQPRRRNVRRAAETGADTDGVRSDAPVKRPRAAARSPRRKAADENGTAIDSAALPPAIGSAGEAGDGDSKPAPRRRRKAVEDVQSMREAG